MTLEEKLKELKEARGVAREHSSFNRINQAYQTMGNNWLPLIEALEKAVWALKSECSCATVKCDACEAREFIAQKLGVETKGGDGE